MNTTGDVKEKILSAWEQAMKNKKSNELILKSNDLQEIYNLVKNYSDEKGFSMEQFQNFVKEAINNLQKLTPEQINAAGGKNKVSKKMAALGLSALTMAPIFGQLNPNAYVGESAVNSTTNFAKKYYKAHTSAVEKVGKNTVGQNVAASLAIFGEVSLGLYGGYSLTKIFQDYITLYNPNSNDKSQKKRGTSAAAQNGKMLGLLNGKICVTKTDNKGKVIFSKLVPEVIQRCFDVISNNEDLVKKDSDGEIIGFNIKNKKSLAKALVSTEVFTEVDADINAAIIDTFLKNMKEGKLFTDEFLDNALVSDAERKMNETYAEEYHKLMKQRSKDDKNKASTNQNKEEESSKVQATEELQKEKNNEQSGEDNAQQAPTEKNSTVSDNVEKEEKKEDQQQAQPDEGAAQPDEGDKDKVVEAQPVEGDKDKVVEAQPDEGAAQPDEGAAQPDEGDKDKVVEAQPDEGAAQPDEGQAVEGDNKNKEN